MSNVFQLLSRLNLVLQVQYPTSLKRFEKEKSPNLFKDDLSSMKLNAEKCR